MTLLIISLLESDLKPTKHVVASILNYIDQTHRHSYIFCEIAANSKILEISFFFV